MLIHLLDTLANLPDVTAIANTVDVSHASWLTSLTHGHHFDLLAQQFDTDVFAGFRRTMNNFVKSGQIWAMLIGFVLGYLLRGVTTYS
jgi:hypothetical protein